MFHRLLPRRFGSLVVSAVILGVTVASGACSQTPAATPADTTTRPGTRVPGTATSSSSSTAKPGTTTSSGPAWTPEEQAIIDGYLAAERGDAEVDQHPNENDPVLEATLVDPLLSQRRKVYEAHRLKGWATRYPSPSVLSITPLRVEMVDADSARLWACYVDDGILFEVATGRVINDKVASVSELAGLRRLDGVWRLAERVEQNTTDGDGGCVDQ